MKLFRAKTLGAWIIGTLALAGSHPAQAVTLIYSNDVLGEVEPCGCRNNPTGGLARKANLLENLKKRSQSDSPEEFVQIDGGDFLFPTDNLPEALEKQSKLQAEYLIQAHNALHHDAVVPGEKDFALGLKVFKTLTGKAKFKFIAANLVEKKSGKPLLKPSLELTRKDSEGKPLKIAILGLVGEGLSWPKELKATSTKTAAKKWVPLLRKKADLVIVLTHQGVEKDQELAKQVPGIDIIVGGHTQSFLQEPIQIGKTWIYQSSFRNQYVGVVPLKKGFASESHSLIALGTEYDSPKNDLHSLTEEMKKKIAELNLSESKLERTPAHAKLQTFSRCAECHFKQFDFWRKTQHANAYNTLVKAKQNFNKECLSCHTVGLGQPGGFSDVKQIAELSGAEGQTKPMDAEELASFLEAIQSAKSGETEVKVEAKLVPLRNSLNLIAKSYTPVQCENCHKMEAEHPFASNLASGNENSTQHKVDKNLCLKCHTAERAPEWYQKGQPNWELIAKKHQSIACPLGTSEE